VCDARRRHTIEDIVVLFQATRANAKGRRQLFTVGLRRSTYLSGVAASQKVTFFRAVVGVQRVADDIWLYEVCHVRL